LDILLVEDDDLVRDCLAEALGDAGLSIEGTTSAEAALVLIKDGRYPGVIVTDINLGAGMDGLAFARAARAAYPCMPIVFISGRYGELRGLSQCERFLAKPFTTPALLRAINDVKAACRAEQPA
jgi:CheY-like chemotaxis protein